MRIFDADVEGMKKGEKCYKCKMSKLVVWRG